MFKYLFDYAIENKCPAKINKKNVNDTTDTNESTANPKYPNIADSKIFLFIGVRRDKFWIGNIVHEKFRIRNMMWEKFEIINMIQNKFAIGILCMKNSKSEIFPDIVQRRLGFSEKRRATLRCLVSVRIKWTSKSRQRSPKVIKGRQRSPKVAKDVNRFFFFVWRMKQRYLS